MIDWSSILAAPSDEGELTKVIVGAVFVLIWVLSGLASAISKGKEEAKRRRAREMIAAGIATPPPLPANARVQTRQQRPTARIATPARQPRRQAPKTARIVQRQQPPTAPFAQAPVVAPTEVPRQPQQPPVVVRRPTTSVTATALNAWLRPATLRQQFILTEVLQPPLALRENPDRI